jgi:hypothetical protein
MENELARPFFVEVLVRTDADQRYRSCSSFPFHALLPGSVWLSCLWIQSVLVSFQARGHDGNRVVVQRKSPVEANLVRTVGSAIGVRPACLLAVRNASMIYGQMQMLNVH